MRFYFTMISLFCAGLLGAQTTADFESFSLTTDSFLNGSDGSMGFSDGNIRLLNDYNTDFDAWSGWAISAATDVTTPGFTNQYSSISGGGADGSSSYAVSFVSGASLIYTTGAAEGGAVEGFHVNNATYAYLSMKDGDAFAKKFGGEDGTDPDFFYLSIKEYGDRNVSNDSLIVYLADFRSDDSAEDYILDEWTYVDLQQFNNVDTLSFQLYSSDNGMFGMNTPGYFCIDNFVTADTKLTAISEVVSNQIQVYPNPSSDQIYVNAEEIMSSYVLYDIYGSIIQNGALEAKQFKLDIVTIPAGTYFLKTINKAGNQATQRIIKQ